MKYTESCHLPQWEKSDRVMMEDFNRMCGDIDRELESAKRTRQKLEQLARDSYRQEVRSRVHHGKGGETDAMWVNALACREDAGGDGHGWNGRYGVSFGPGSMPTLDEIRKNAKEELYVCTNATFVYQNSNAVTTFTSDGHGMLDTITVWRTHDYRVESKEFSFTIIMIRMDTGEEAGRAGPFTTSTTAEAFPVNFPLEAEVPYRMEFSLPENSGFLGFAGFLLASEHHSESVDEMTFSERTEADTISHLICPRSDAATALVRWRGDGSVSLLVNGMAMTPVRNQETVNAQGEACIEEEFSMQNILQEEIPFSLRIQHSGNDLTVYDYGLIWM